MKKKTHKKRTAEKMESMFLRYKLLKDDIERIKRALKTEEPHFPQSSNHSVYCFVSSKTRNQLAAKFKPILKNKLLPELNAELEKLKDKLNIA